MADMIFPQIKVPGEYVPRVWNTFREGWDDDPNSEFRQRYPTKADWVLEQIIRMIKAQVKAHEALELDVEGLIIKE